MDSPQGKSVHSLHVTLNVGVSWDFFTHMSMTRQPSINVLRRPWCIGRSFAAPAQRCLKFTWAG
eukprot:2930526-Amphidinium_carterae.1